MLAWNMNNDMEEAYLDLDGDSGYYLGTKRPLGYASTATSEIGMYEGIPNDLFCNAEQAPTYCGGISSFI
jgi:hypothetical protein